MTERERTIAVLGSTPFAAFLAGVIATDHSPDVVWVRDTATPSLLPRAIDISLAPLARPQTWRVLLGQRAEVHRHLERLDAAITHRTDLVMHARSPAARDALAHVAHIAESYDCALDPLAADGDGARLTAHDATILDSGAFWRAMPAWLDSLGVASVPWETEIALGEDGSARVGDRRVGQLVVADTPALRRLDMGISLRAAGTFRPWSATLGVPLSPLPAPAGTQMDTGLWWHQPTDASAIVHAPARTGDESEALAALPSGTAVRTAGRSRFERFETKDGAALVGRLRGSNAVALEALGPTALFLTPMLARFVCGTATGTEKNWCAARHPSRAFKRQSVADWPAAGLSGHAAA